MTQGTLHRSLTMTCCELLAHSRLSAAAAVFAALLVSNAQQASAQHQLSPGGATPQDGAAPDLQSQPDSAIRPSKSGKVDDEDNAKQSKRILWIFPNYRAVSAGTQLPALSLREKFWLATQDSFDYSSFVSAGIIAGISQANKSYPEFGQGAKGYGRYYWHAMSDQAVGNYLTEAIVPAVTHEDPRYYTLGHGGFLKRTGYALSRVVLTKTDSGGTSFNSSEILGNGMEAGLSNFYYPPEERGLHNTAVNWAAQLEAAALNNLIREFWRDIRRNILRQK